MSTPAQGGGGTARMQGSAPQRFSEQILGAGPWERSSSRHHLNLWVIHSPTGEEARRAGEGRLAALHNRRCMSINGHSTNQAQLCAVPLPRTVRAAQQQREPSFRFLLFDHQELDTFFISLLRRVFARVFWIATGNLNGSVCDFLNLIRQFRRLCSLVGVPTLKSHDRPRYECRLLIVRVACSLLCAGLPTDAHARGSGEKGPRTADFFVAVNGSDRWSGQLDQPNRTSTDGPFATLARARDAVRALKQRGDKQEIRVLIRGGVHSLKETVVFALEDSAPAGGHDRICCLRRRDTRIHFGRSDRWLDQAGASVAAAPRDRP